MTPSSQARRMSAVRTASPALHWSPHFELAVRASSFHGTEEGCSTMSLPKVDKIWMDGELVDWDKAQVHVLTHALHYGSGVFEGIRCYETADGPAVFRLSEHMERFERSAKMLYMDLGYSVDEMVDAVKETIRANGLEELLHPPDRVSRLRRHGTRSDPRARQRRPSLSGRGTRTSAKTASPRASRSASRAGVSAASTRRLRRSRRPVSTSTARSLASRRTVTATPRRSCSTKRARSARAPARTSSWCATASSRRRRSPTASSRASRATRSWSSPTTWATRSSRSRSSAPTSTPATSSS